ncbi:NUDIX hydrolase [Marine Group I thaumarchaeote]|uniref:NUDIX hydrolase n=1 Tax=Marine Group I thaumarchaeote TaxID=2511932 RepID=A0A7K4NKF0_9ARCH|nr:NUDIX hydrolase [Marine Group I thaumarchaeote]
MILKQNKKKKVYDGKNFSVNVFDVSIENRKFQREIIEQKSASAVLAFEGTKVILVKQNRFPHGYVLEIPAGTLNKNENPRACAIRELIEETGYKPKKLKHLINYYPNVGYNTQFIHCYVAQEIEKISEIKLEPDEFFTLVKIDFKKLLNMIVSGKIIDSKTICAALTYAKLNSI